LALVLTPKNQFSSVFCTKCQVSSDSGLKGWVLSAFVSFALRFVYLHPSLCAEQYSAAKAVLSACSAK
jgi:hypothetical protein